MGILNITRDSFSDGGEYYTTENAIARLNQLVREGADIIDIGAESTKPGAKEISAQNQLEHIIPVLTYARENDISIPISIDTRNAEVAKKCIELGATIINDVSGFDFDPNMINVMAANPNIKIVLQHSKGTPENMQNSPHYDNLMDEIYINLENKVKNAVEMGIHKENIIIDPGIGFGKTREHNFEILKRWSELKTIGCPVLIGISRKSLLNNPQAANEEKDVYTTALNAILIDKNIDYIRVHNVSMHKKLLSLL